MTTTSKINWGAQYRAFAASGLSLPDFVQQSTALAGESRSAILEHFLNLAGRRKLKNTPFAKAVVYFLNRKDNLEAFLDDPELPCHSNAVERTIRAITISRSASNFMQTQSGIEALLTTQSLIQTLRLNGVQDPIEFIQDYVSQAVIDCYERNGQAIVRNILAAGENPENVLNSNLLRAVDYPELMKGFNFKPWLRRIPGISTRMPDSAD